MADLKRKNIEAILPLTPQQATMFFHCQQSQNSSAGMIQCQFDVEGELDKEIWHQSWKQLVREHQALRASIHQIKGNQPRMVIWKSCELPWNFVDLSQRTKNEQLELMTHEVEARKAQGLKLRQPPAMSVSTYRLSKNRYRVYWNHHHIFIDGWSSKKLIEFVLEWTSSSHSQSGCAIKNEVRPKTTYRDYLSNQTALNLRQTESFWTSQLSNCRATQLMPDAIEPSSEASANEARTAQADVFIDAADVQMIRESLREIEMTSNALIRSAWGLTLSRLTHSQDVVFGISVSGRATDITGSEEVVGFFSQIVPCRIEFDQQSTSKQVIREAQAQQFEAQRHQTVGLAKILEVTNLPESLFDTVLMTQQPFEISSPNGNLHVNEYSSSTTSGFGLTVNVITGETWRLQLFANHSAVGKSLLDDWAGQFKQSLLELPQTPDSRLDQLAPGLRLKVFQPASEDAPETSLLSSSQTVRAGSDPVSQTELNLLGIWANILGHDKIELSDNFFALGGKSISAVRMVGQIERQLGRTLLPSIVLKHGTIQDLAAHIDGPEDSHRYHNLVPITMTHPSRRLFCVHGGDGYVMFYRHFAEELKEKCSVYGIQPFGLYGREKPLESIQAMAAAYVGEIRKAQPTGPYHILGHCSGGVIAYEMVQQLLDDGQDVGILAIVDSECPTICSSSTPSSGDATVGSSKEREPQFKYSLRKLRRYLRSKLANATGNETWRQELNVKWVWNSTGQAVRTYRTGKLNHPGLLIFGEDASTHHVDPFAWSNAIANLETIKMDCHHEDFFERPFVSKLADIVGNHLMLSEQANLIENSTARKSA